MKEKNTPLSFVDT